MTLNVGIKVLGCVLIACALAGRAAEVERIELGLGYDRARDGHGFDLHKAGDTYILYFYSYGDDGAPEWFVGTSELNGGVLSGELLRFNSGLDSGVVQDQSFNGSFSLDFNAAQDAGACNDGVDRAGARQLAAFAWQTGLDSGQWCTEWLAFGSGNASFPYYGGVWYAGPADPGYGFTMAHMDQTVVAVFYYYDAAGQPRWALGTGGQEDVSIRLSSFDGYCRGCPPRAPTAHDAGALTLSLGDDAAAVELTYPGPPGGRFQRDFDLHRLSDGSSFAQYRPDPALAFFSTSISAEIIQSRCVLCHVNGGIAASTRLVFETAAAAGYQARNLDTLRNFLASVPAGDQLILSKVRGEAHGGSAQLSEQSLEYGNLSLLLDLLTEEPPPSEAESFFAGVKMLDEDTSLRRAALLFAGRLPTAAELEAHRSAGHAGRRQVIRDLMQGAQFHQFLLTGANDRLLTDQFLELPIIDISSTLHFPDLLDRVWELAGAGDGGGLLRLVLGTAFGVARAPLELIAHVVENDLPYGDILTADYTLVNPATSLAFGSQAQFSDPQDMNLWRLGRIESYIRLGEGISFRCNPYCQVFSGGLATDFPHAGILNSLAFLSRYPSTATNRNRARARWSYYFFLGVDIEKLATRPLDPDALTDTDNPTLNNPDCTACHVVHDPVAGAFQDYGDEGFYKDSIGGADSLPDSYKFPESGGLYVQGDTWYRDMRAPGFSGRAAPAGRNSLQWLAAEIAADPRFPAATVKFWWPAVFGAEPLEQPPAANDAGFPARQTAYQAQQRLVTELAEGFDSGFVPGRPMNLKDLLAEMVLSDWFRAQELSTPDPQRIAAYEYAKAGGGRLLTPEQLARKLEAVTGKRWAYSRYEVAAGELVETDFLNQDYRLYYGGIDSGSVIRRVREMNGLMAKVVENLALEMSCPIVVDEFAQKASERRLFGAAHADYTPATELVTRVKTSGLETHGVSGPLNAGSLVLEITNVDTDPDRNSPPLRLGDIEIADGQGNSLFSFSGNEAAAASGCGVATGDNWSLAPGCRVSLQLDLDAGADYRFSVEAASAPDEGVMIIAVNREDADYADTRGSLRIRNTLRQLHAALLGETLTADDPELARSYRLFTDIWSARRARAEEPWVNNECDIGIVPYAERRRPAADPLQTLNTWVAITSYFLSDYRFIIE